MSTIVIDLPQHPKVGMRFRPDKTDSIGTIVDVRSGGREGTVVTYKFDHEPEVTHTRPWFEVRRLGWALPNKPVQYPKPRAAVTEAA